MQDKAIGIAILTTGDELMSGDLVDTNSAFMAKALAQIGLQVKLMLTVGDSLEQLVSTFTALSHEYDFVIVNGGLGPTQDDYTSQAICEAFGFAQVRNEAAYQHLIARVKQLNASQLKQADLPEGCGIIPNPEGTAVGFSVVANGCTFFCTPGVPRELFCMWEQTIFPQFSALKGIAHTRVRTLKTFGLGESVLQSKIKDEYNRRPELLDDRLDVGFRASFPYVDLKLTSRHAAAELCELDQSLENMKALLGDYVVSDSGKTLEQEVMRLLLRQGKTLAVAESCTGGFIAASLAKNAGASAFFLGGCVAYSNALKTDTLGVSAGTISRKGAVSAETAQEMLTGILAISGADYAISTTGILGPDSDGSEKPVGTVFTAYGTKENHKIRQLHIAAHRQGAITLVQCIALDLFRRFASGAGQEDPGYYAPL